MKSISTATLGLAIALTAAMSATVRADFFEDFESYTVGNSTLGAPWVAGAQFGVIGDISDNGYDPSNGFHSNGADWNDAARATNYDPLAGIYEFAFKFQITSANGIPRVTGGVGLANLSSALLWEVEGYIASPSNFPTARINLPGGGAHELAGRNVWYELLVTLTDLGGGNWSWSADLANEADGFTSSINIGGGATPANFLPDTVHLQSIFAFDEVAGESTLDDVSFTSIPEPATLGLLGLGGLMILRRRAA